MVLEENSVPSAAYTSMPGLQPQMQLPPGFAYAQPAPQQQQQQQHPQFVVVPPQPTIGTSSTPLSTQLRILVICSVLVGCFALLVYSWGLYAVYHDSGYDYNTYRTYERNTTLMVFVKIIFPILQGLLWFAGVALVIFPHLLPLQLLWGLVAFVHLLLNLVGIVHFIVVLSMNFESIFLFFILVVWVPVLQGIALLLLGSSLRVMGKYMCELRQQAANGGVTVGATVPMTVFASPTGAINV